MITKIINVTARDIDMGKRKSGCKCPIALAVKRTFKKAEFLAVTYYEILFEEDGKTPDFKLPEKATEFIRCFDNGESVRPFKFRVKSA